MKNKSNLSGEQLVAATQSLMDYFRDVLNLSPFEVLYVSMLAHAIVISNIENDNDREFMIKQAGSDLRGKVNKNNVVALRVSLQQSRRVRSVTAQAAGYHKN